MRKRIKRISVCLSVCCVAVLGLVLFGYFTLPQAITVSAEIPAIGMYSPVASRHAAVSASASATQTANSQQDYALFGVVPVKTVSVTQTDRKYVYAGGDVIGLQMLTDGVIVVDVQSFESVNGEVSPAKDAGLQKGDIITAVNGVQVSDNQSFSSAISDSSGQEIDMTFIRGVQEKHTLVTPQLCKQSGVYRCGAWVRDSTVGIGTMTYYDPSTGIYGALGHCVSDMDTGEMLPIAGGQIVDAYVWNIKKGESGTAGELGGSLEEEVIGSIEKNCQSGVYGILYEAPLCAGEYPVAWETEVKAGPAEIMLSLDGETIESYDIEIERINADYNAEIKNMVVRITDEALLEKTGGIVQGMSGSPIVQNGMLVGAVTHVLVNDPTKGYGIFIENMLDAAA
ncbi:MAG: SpoIVB peptidase [Clostridia bacterium]|nr:SpoIVB peptidase [Clostridia bacterium]